MNRYQITNVLGEGSFGTVHLAVNKETHEKYAIKILKESLPWKDLIKMRELQSLMRLNRHPSIVALIEVIRSQDGLVSFVFEYMTDGSLHDFIMENRANRTSIPEQVIVSLTNQAFQGLAHLHRLFYIHRDVKPENFCICRRRDGSIILKLADFSLARGPHEATHPLTAYISTRWYRAPEVLLGSIARNMTATSLSTQHAYNTSMDIFAMGCIVTELFRLRPLFPGQSELHQLQLIVNLLGPLPATMTAQYPGSFIAQTRDQQSPAAHLKCPRARVELIMADSRTQAVSFAANDFCFQSLALDPEHRLTSEAALQHEFVCNGSIPGALDWTTSQLSASASSLSRDAPPPVTKAMHRRASEENVAPNAANVHTTKLPQNANKRLAMTTPNSQRPTPESQVVTASPQQFHLRMHHDNSHLT
ncbi:hypothetical protein MPSEU_001043700 [Mayamaea pseudoterrestris]|nr:hypothetical protein MPSEU_001043700 [Mayamaea pseudoterrestris]